MQFFDLKIHSFKLISYNSMMCNEENGLIQDYVTHIIPDWTVVLLQEGTGHATSVIQSYTRPAGRGVSIAGVPFFPF